MTKQEKAKDARLRREFHITLEEYNKILDYQDGGCAICCKKVNKKGKPLILAVDHNHDVNNAEVRGLVCWLCNKGIAIFQDSWQRCKKAYEYLFNPPVRAVLGKRLTAGGKVGTIKRKKLLAAFNAAREGNGKKGQKSRKSSKI
jgi:hypothetical protein